MHVEQAIYTSMSRDGRAGYHVVSRSAGVSDDDARTLASWSPSHGALVVDAANRASVNFHPLSPGHHALSRSCEGRAEYSGRGGRQVYTHALILETSQLEQVEFNLFALYRDALALGLIQFQADPAPALEPVELGHCHRPVQLDRLAERAGALNEASLADARRRLASSGSVDLPFQGDRAALTEWLLAALPLDVRPSVSFSTSLAASSARPFRLWVHG